MATKDRTNGQINGENGTEGVGIGSARLPAKPVEVKVIDRRFWAKKSSECDEAEEATAEEFDERRLRPTYVEELEKKYNDAAAQVQEVLSAYRKLRSEQEGFRTRMEKQREHRIFEFKKQFFNRLLETLDNFDRAIQAIGKTSSVETILTGLHMMLSQLERLMVDEGLVKITGEGETYDPSVAEVIAIETTDDPNLDHKVKSVLHPGFKLNNLLLRPAKVCVYQLPNGAARAKGTEGSSPSTGTSGNGGEHHNNE